MTILIRLATWAALGAFVAASAGAGAAQQKGAADGGGPAELLAAQLRTQGFRCDKPVSAQQDAGRSKPDEAVWIVRCANASYRMRLIPDMAAVVEPLD
jgi:hypothetical protein